MPNLIAAIVPPGALAANPQPALPAERGLLLRPWRARDAAAVVSGYADPEIQRWHLLSMDTEEEAAQWVDQCHAQWRAETGASWAVADVGSDAVLGRIAVRELNLEEGRGELAYWVLPAARRRRVATAAVNRVSGWAFELGLYRLELRHSTHNQPSCLVAQSAGFRLEGTSRGFELHEDGWHDAHLHARLATDEVFTPPEASKLAGGVRAALRLRRGIGRAAGRRG
jgi:RimJ/RimL family protein N-acetyltransferase